METINQKNSGSLSALIVDDDPTMQKICKLYMTKRGFSTMVVKNGKEAVDLYDADKYFDIIIMDLEMPVMNGIEATKKLREMGVKSLIVGATASTNTADVENFKNAGLDKCYAKPLSGEMYDEMILPLKKG